MSGKKSNPLSVYAVVSQISFVILAPLLLFIVGGHYAVEFFGWPDWAMGICVALGIIFMLGGAVNFLAQLIARYGKDDKSKYTRAYSNPKDNDYYDDHGR